METVGVDAPENRANRRKKYQEQQRSRKREVAGAAD